MNDVPSWHLTGTGSTSASAAMGFFVDAKADDRQREAIQAILSGQAGGWPATRPDFVPAAGAMSFGATGVQFVDPQLPVE